MGAFTAYSPELAGLPADWRKEDQQAKAKTLLNLKADDTAKYQQLRNQAIRCGR